ncbi:hypothetical protein DFH11DRAFT_1582431 [Phellopilus nigrolimitatus]|nr:hypothetical protein DFH11DRAFT_1582431 [Phellopilus nigrolimitatus]
MTVEHVIHRPRPHPSPPPSPTLVSATPTASAPASVAIGHVQLRDLIVCPVERGVVWYVGDRSIIEQDILAASPRQRTLALLPFTPVTLAALPLPSSSSPPSDDVRVLLAAGGQDADLFLALYSYTPHRTKCSTRASGSLLPPEEALKGDDAHGGHSTPIWQHTSSLIGSINNNVLLYLPPGADAFDVPEEDPEEDQEDTPHTQARTSPRLIVSNNDCTVKFFDVCLARGGLRRAPASPLQAARALDARYWRRAGRERGGWGERGERSAERLVRYERVGLLRLPVPVNHTSISPDGSTLLSCGDAATIYLHRILPVRDGTTLLFEPLAQYEMPIPAPSSSLPHPSPPPASSSSLTRHASPPSSSYLPFAFVDGAWVVAAPFSASHLFPPFYSNNDNNGGGSADSGAAAPPACFATAWSADGTRFAAASQEGAVRVWDVRSGAPLAGAQWETARTGPPEFSTERNAGTGAGASPRWLEQAGAAPPWSVRALRFARTPGGREVLVFTEHVERVHVIDADTFETHDVLRVPHGQPGAPAARPRAEEGAYAPYPSASSSAFAYPDHGYGYDHDATNAAFSLAFPYPGYLDAYFDGEGEDAGDDSTLLSTLRDRYEARERRRARREILLSDARSAGLGMGMGMETGIDTETRTDMERVAFMGSPTMPPPRRVLSPYRPFTRSPDEMDVDADAPPPPASSQPADAAQVQAQRQRVAGALARARRARERVEDARMEADIAFHARRGEREREEGAVVIPPLARASAEEEADVRRVLRAHGIATQGGNGEDREDIECVEEPAEGPSNAGRPEPFAGPTGPGPYADEGAGTTTPPSASTSANTIATFLSASPRGPSHASSPPLRAPSSTPPESSAPPGSSPSASHAPDTAPALPPCAELIAATARVDIAGVALDPCGAYVYVASAEGVTEWAVRGAGRRWWRAGGWM